MKSKILNKEISSIERAMEILDDPLEDQMLWEQAIRYISHQPSEKVIKRLVWALQDDEFGIRWEASTTLARLGKKALPELLKALTDPDRVGDPRLREGAYRVLHSNLDPFYAIDITQLLQVLRGPAADIATMEAAGKILAQIEKQAQ